MAKHYSIYNTAAIVAGIQLGIYQAAATPLQRPVIYEFELGSHATPVDQASAYEVLRITTAAPTGGTNPTVAQLDLADPAPAASNTTAYQASTGGATLSTVLAYIGLHMKATFRWVTDPTMGYVIPATQYAGGGLFVANQSAAYNVDTTLVWTE